MTKIDFKKTLKPLFAPKAKKYELIEIPKMNFLMIDGKGEPGTSEAYQQSLEALYPLAYKTKFLSKQMGKDYVVPPLQGLWWAEDMDDFVNDNKHNWQWTLMIMLPDWVDENMVSQARENAANPPANKQAPLLLDKVRFEAYDEGLVAQYLHIGAYADEAPVLHHMHHVYIPENGYQMCGKHHEIYLSDPRRCAPEKLKTILRQPVSKKLD